MDPATVVIRGITLFIGCAFCDCSLNKRSVTKYRDGEPRVSLACRVQSHDDAVRDYLRPDEVGEVTVQAARKSGRHQVRDAAMIVPKRANWLVCPLCPHPHQLRHAYGYYLAPCEHNTRAIQDSIWDIRTFSIRCDTPRWHRTDLKASGMIKLCRFSNGIGEKSYTKPSSSFDTDCTFAPKRAIPGMARFPFIAILAVMPSRTYFLRSARPKEPSPLADRPCSIPQ